MGNGSYTADIPYSIIWVVSVISSPFFNVGLNDCIERRDGASSVSIVDGFQHDADEERLEKWFPLHVERFVWPRHMPEEVYF